MKPCLHYNGIEIYLTYNGGKSIVAERFFRNLKNKIYEHITAASKNMHINKLDEASTTTHIMELSK